MNDNRDCPSHCRTCLDSGYVLDHDRRCPGGGPECERYCPVQMPCPDCDTPVSPPMPYAVSRIDALRRLRREGYAVVNREALALLIARYENGDTTRDEESDLALGDLRSSVGNTREPRCVGHYVGAGYSYNGLAKNCHHAECKALAAVADSGS